MVFSDGLTLTLFFILFFGFGALLYSVWRVRSHYDRLTKGVSGATLTSTLHDLLGEVVSLQKRTDFTERAIKALQTEGMSHVQRIGVVRFNPFLDTGGAQSFTIAILDGHRSGIVMTSLYARTGNRWYVKTIGEGKGKDIELSKEEIAAIRQAMAGK